MSWSRYCYAACLSTSLILAAAEGPVTFWSKNIVLESGRWVALPDPFADPGAPRPYPPQKDFFQEATRDSSSIIVLIASLRETKLVDTLITLFSRARRPERVFAGVVQQNARLDSDVLEDFCRRLGSPLELREAFRGRAALHRRQADEDVWGHQRYTQASLDACPLGKHVRVFRMSAEEAAGPAFARSRQPLLLQRGDAMEDFCMQIDAHTVFLQGWDAHLLWEWAMTRNEYAVLTTYPTGTDQLLENGTVRNANNHWEMPTVCQAKLVKDGVVRNDRAAAVANLDRPALAKLWAAGLSFSRCHAERDVPNDPGLRHIFNGEEFSRGARLWTNGYDLYAPARPAIATYYGGAKGGLGGWRSDAAAARKSHQRLGTLLRVPGADRSSTATGKLRGFDLGTRRSLSDYIALTGVDTMKQTNVNTPCSVSRWKPWADASQPPYTFPLDGSPVRLGVDVATTMGIEVPSLASAELATHSGMQNSSLIAESLPRARGAEQLFTLPELVDSSLDLQGLYVMSGGIGLSILARLCLCRGRGGCCSSWRRKSKSRR